MSDSFNSWTVAHQALLSMDFSRQEHWNGLPFPVPGDLPNTGIEPASPPWQAVSCIAGRFFTTEPSVKPIVKESVNHSVLPDFLWPHGLKPTWLLCHGIFQSRILEWFSISFSRGLSQPRDQICRQIHYHLSHQGSPYICQNSLNACISLPAICNSIII